MPATATTLGRIMVDESLPRKYRGLATNPKALDDVLVELAREDPNAYKKTTAKLVRMGGDAAYETGSTIRLRDLQASEHIRKDFIQQVNAAERAIKAQKLPPDQERKALDEAYTNTYDEMVKAVYADALASGNSIAKQVAAKARGNPTSLTAMLASPGPFRDAKGRLLPIFPKRGYSEGLKPWELYATTFGARHAAISTKFCLAEGTEVLMADYSVKAIEDVVTGDRVFSVDAEGQKVVTTVTAKFDNGPRECVRYVFAKGRARKEELEVVCTPDHKLYMTKLSKGAPVRNLERAELAKKARRGAVLAGAQKRKGGRSESFAMTIGQLIGDGSLTQHNANRFRREEPVGVVPTHDLEVRHPSHMFVLANGMIVSNSTRDAGYLGKQLGTAAEHLIVTEADCGTHTGIPVEVTDTDSVGAVLAQDTGPFKRGTVIDKKMLDALDRKGYEDIIVRSPITCKSRGGVCQSCAGEREDQRFPEIGHAIGVTAASALAERVAQSSLNVKHSGGQKGKGAKGDEEETFAGFDVINQLAQVPKTFKHKAVLADQDGTVEQITEAPQGGWFINVAGVEHYVEPDRVIRVKEGDEVEAGDQMTSGIVSPAEVVKYKGLGEGRRYFASRLTQAFRDSNLTANRRNAEVIARAAVDHVMTDTDIGDYLPGDVASYSAIEHDYVPRENRKTGRPEELIGSYLEQPVLHHTIGTRVTKRMADQLNKHGIDKVVVNEDPAPFTPEMLRMAAVVQTGRDWMAKLHGSYLVKGLLSDVHRGAESNIHGTNPVPGVAYGMEFGNSRPGKTTY